MAILLSTLVCMGIKFAKDHFYIVMSDFHKKVIINFWYISDGLNSEIHVMFKNFIVFTFSAFQNMHRIKSTPLRASDSINANLPIFDKLLQPPRAAKAELSGISR